MARKPEDIDPNEIKTSQYHHPIILALYQLGGSARKEPVIKIVGEMLKDVLRDCDKRKMYHRPKPYGWQLAPPDWTGKTIRVWESKASHAHRWLVDEDLAVASGGVQTLNAKGLEYIARLIENEH
jgi:hypothetical protein